MRYYLQVGTETVGPVEAAEVRRLRSGGAIHLDSKVCREGETLWTPLGQFPEFADSGNSSTQRAETTKAEGVWKKRARWGLAFLLFVIAVSGAAGLVVGLLLIAFAVVLKRKKGVSWTPWAWGFNPARGYLIDLLVAGAMVAASLPRLSEQIAEVRVAKERQAQAEIAAKAASDGRTKLKATAHEKAKLWKGETSSLDFATPATARPACEVVRRVAGESESLAKGLAPETSPYLDAFRRELSPKVTTCGAIDEFVANANKATDLLRRAKISENTKAWISADDDLVGALAALDTVEKSNELRAHVPSGFDARQLRSQAEAIRKSIQPLVKAARTEVEAAQAYAELCGARPERSQWDGEIVGLESIIRRNAHDPDSIDVENCTQPLMTPKNCWRFTCEVRGKNAFGNKVLSRKTFTMSKLGVSEVE